MTSESCITMKTKGRRISMLSDSFNSASGKPYQVEAELLAQVNARLLIAAYRTSQERERERGLLRSTWIDRAPSLSLPGAGRATSNNDNVAYSADISLQSEWPRAERTRWQVRGFGREIEFVPSE